MSSDIQHKYTNRLSNETSPYLLQHAHNPVDWYPWGREALDKAKNEDKPIFLSVGYSACHWCHVMEHECFENEQIAKLMNEHFINIKVDREERPDIDEIYMNAVQVMTGHGGWPMSVFLTPDLKPFYGGTYFPPVDRHGMPGFPSVLLSISNAYQEHRSQIEESAEKLTQHLQESMKIVKSQTTLKYDHIEQAYAEMERRYDSTFGGFGQAPKFPHSMDIGLLLRYYYKNKNEKALRMAEFSLEKMAKGGMYDQLGGGFHRYSTDAKWLIPHFEKMLYDNALLSMTYTEAYQITKKSFYKKIVTETLDYVLREMVSPEGSFYSTQDADSEGKEGAFFVWTPQQIKDILGEKDGSIFCRYYGVDESGNFEHGTSALHISNDDESVAKLLEISVDDLVQILDSSKKKLWEAREERIKPGRDEKILADWNGLMISSMALAGNIFNESRYTKAAESACEFLVTKMKEHDRMYHTYKDGRAHTTGFLSDYSFTVVGLLDTYEATHNARWLTEAMDLTQSMITHFWDDEGGAFFFTADDHERLITRSKDPMDNAIPSGNSMATLALVRLAEMTGNQDYRQKAETCLQVFVEGYRQYPAAYPQMLVALDFILSSPKEIVLTAEKIEQVYPMKQMIFDTFLPHKVVLYADPSVEKQLQSLSSVFQGKTPVEGKSTAYICENFSCQQPIVSMEELVKSLQ
jgi:uncharacterized protein YyaL (SSP411 family)